MWPWAVGKVGKHRGGSGTGRAGGATGPWLCLSCQAFPPLHPSQLVTVLALKVGRYKSLDSKALEINQFEMNLQHECHN